MMSIQDILKFYNYGIIIANEIQIFSRYQAIDNYLYCQYNMTEMDSNYLTIQCIFYSGCNETIVRFCCCLCGCWEDITGIDLRRKSPQRDPGNYMWPFSPLSVGLETPENGSLCFHIALQ